MNADQSLRQHVLDLLLMKGAHANFADTVAEFPESMINTRPPSIPYTCWHLVEHMRIAQWDILEYTRDPQHVSPEWPSGYWGERGKTADLAAWNQSIEQFQRDLQAMQDIVADPNTDLLSPIPHGRRGHTVLREALLLADHNAYHVGELTILRRVIGAWQYRA